MIEVEPKVFLIGEMEQHEGIMDWLQHVEGGEVLDHLKGNCNERLVELAARRCYKSFKPGLNPNVTKVRTDSKEFHENVLESGHGSVLEHGYCTFAFEDVSRVFTHEMVRNRAGLAYSQESLRYVRLGELRFWIPPEIKEEKEALRIFRYIIKECEGVQKALADLFDIDNIKDKRRKQQLTSAFRRIAPIGLATGIVVSFNMRALRHVIVQRTSPAAEIEMRIVFGKVGEIANERWPMLFQDFTFEWDDKEQKVGSWVSKYVKV